MRRSVPPPGAQTSAPRESRNAANRRSLSGNGYFNAQLLFERSPLPAWVFDPAALRILDVNAAALKRYGYRRSEFLGLSLSALAPREAGRRTSRRLLAKPGETRHRTKSGEVFDVDLRCQEVSIDGRRMVLCVAVDISERKRAEAALRESEEAMRAILVSATEGVLTVDAKGLIRFANPRLHALFGYRPGELVGRSVDILLPPRLRTLHARHRNKYMRRPAARAMGHGRDLVGLRKDGTEFPVEISLSPVETSGGVLALGLVTDITERKRDEERRLSDAHRLETLHEIDRAILHGQTVREIASRAAEQMLRSIDCQRVAVSTFEEPGEWLVQAAAGLGQRILGPGSRAPAHPGRLRSLRRGARQVSVRLGRGGIPRYIRPLYDLGLRSYVALPLRSGRRLVGVLAIFSTGTQVKQEDIEVARQVGDQLAVAMRQAELREELERHAHRLETLHQIDRSILTGRGVKEIAASAARRLAQTLGCERVGVLAFEEPDQLVMLAAAGAAAKATPHGTHVSVADHFLDVNEFRRGKVQLVDGTKAGRRTAFMRRLRAAGLRTYAAMPMRVGEELIGAVTVWSARPQGVSPEALAIATEVADQLAVALRQARLLDEVQKHATELEQRVAERTADLEDANSELQAFAYSVSHDLRAPLRAMRGFGQALLEDYGPGLDDVAKDFIGRIVDAADHMDDLIQDLLSYSRVSRAEWRLEPVNLRRATEEALRQNEEAIKTSGATVVDNVPEIEVLGHEQTMTQVLANLISNAVKFHRDGLPPHVTLSARRVNGWVRLTVKDNGVGISKEHQGRIFRIFERLHGMERYPGTGIGLAIVKKGAERMDGRFGVRSSPGKGSEFWVELRPA